MKLFYFEWDSWFWTSIDVPILLQKSCETSCRCSENGRSLVPPQKVARALIYKESGQINKWTLLRNLCWVHSIHTFSPSQNSKAFMRSYVWLFPAIEHCSRTRSVTCLSLFYLSLHNNFKRSILLSYTISLAVCLWSSAKFGSGKSHSW